MKKTTLLKNLINSETVEILMEAHNGISARIVEEVGFKGIWASGLAISASMAIRDSNELSYTQVMDIVEYMSDITSIPILLDGDTGYGNFNNARRLIKKLEKIKVAGVCIEDKPFPKTNSLLEGAKQQLVDIEEFSGKIKAMKDSVEDDDFVIVARVEAFIAGLGIKETLKRAEAYRQAGADAVLIHSKNKDASQIIEFMKNWGNRLPVVIVPTTYYSVPIEVYKNLGISTVIWANHSIRASIYAMQNILKEIYLDNSVVNIDKKIVSVKEIFRLQDLNELKEAEKKYLPRQKNFKEKEGI